MIRLLFIAPWLAIPLVGGVVIYIIYQIYHRRQNLDLDAWNSGPPAPLHREHDTDDLRKLDPDFSQVLFEDFAFRLFSTAQRARTTPAGLASIAPYVSPTAQTQLAKRDPDDGSPVEQVIVGAQRIYSIDVPDAAVDDNNSPNYVRIGVEYEANVMVGNHTYYSVERWSLHARRAAHEQAAESVEGFPVPELRRALASEGHGHAGVRDVRASRRQRPLRLGRRARGPRLDGSAPAVADRRGPRARQRSAATMFAPTVNTAWSDLAAADTALTKDALAARVQLIYDTLNKAWSDNKLEPARGMVSDGLYDYLEYWVKAYVGQHLRNELVDMRMTQPPKVAKVIRDKWYDAVTVRIWGTGKDLVVNTDTDKVLRGSRSREREYSEYWTIIRSASRKGAPIATAVCRQLRCAARDHDGGQLRALRRARHGRRVRLGAVEDRARRHVSALTSARFAAMSSSAIDLSEPCAHLASTKIRSVHRPAKGLRRLPENRRLVGTPPASA